MDIMNDLTRADLELIASALDIVNPDEDCDRQRARDLSAAIASKAARLQQPAYPRRPASETYEVIVERCGWTEGLQLKMCMQLLSEHGITGALADLAWRVECDEREVEEDIKETTR